MIVIPVLKPNLHGALRHVDILGDAFPHGGCRGRVLVKLDLQGDELILRGSLSLLILLLLSESALA